MAKLTMGQKAERVLRFLLGVRKPRVASALAAYGFTQASLDEGWALLRSLTGEKLSIAPLERPLDPGRLEQLDAWENRWLAIAEATLQRHHPAVAEKVFLNLSRTTGPDVIVSVSTFLTRIAALAGGSADDTAARALLTQRGLTDAVVAEAQTLLDDLGVVQSAPAPIIDEAALQAAEDAMWAWYLAWSVIARGAISNGNLVRSLGFLRGRSRVVGDDEEGEDDGAVGDEGSEGVVPAPV